MEEGFSCKCDKRSSAKNERYARHWSEEPCWYKNSGSEKKRQEPDLKTLKSPLRECGSKWFGHIEGMDSDYVSIGC